MLAPLSWEFLLRVQSEGVPLGKGGPWDADCLDSSRHSAVWVSYGMVYMRLQRRKYRPHGSLMKRACSCQRMTNNYCIVHRVGAWLYEQRYGTQLFAFTAAQFKAEVVRGAIQSGPGNAASSVRRRFGSDIVGR